MGAEGVGVDVRRKQEITFRIGIMRKCFCLNITAIFTRSYYPTLYYQDEVNVQNERRCVKEKAT